MERSSRATTRVAPTMPRGKRLSRPVHSRATLVVARLEDGNRLSIAFASKVLRRREDLNSYQ